MITKNLPFVRFLSVGAILALAMPAFAQEVAAGGTKKPGFLEDVFANAGVIGYIIMLMSVVAVAMIIESVATIKREKLAPPDMIDELEALFDGENFQDAVELCENEKNYLTNVVGAGLSKLGHSFETMQVAIREMQTEESVKMFQKIGYLSMLAGIGPMMGLLGTVTGMFDTFGTIASAGGSVSPALLAGGIKGALVTTILGLIVAIPTGVGFFILKNRVIRTSTEINAIAEDLFERFRAKS